MSDRVQFTCNGVPVSVTAAPGESLLSALREQLSLTSPKDGCAPQGQCGCCTVLVDGAPRVACVTPLTRVAGRTVTTVEGLDPALRDELAARLTATGGAQCGFCTPGILVRAAALQEHGRTRRPDVERALAAHLCRCTGWQTIFEALDSSSGRSVRSPRNLDGASERAALEGGTSQRVGPFVALGDGGFADDHAPRDALVAVPARGGDHATEAAGRRWMIAESLAEARGLAGGVQGRRTTVEASPALALPTLPAGGVRLATSWLETAYLETDASWCLPGGEPASPLANGGAFGGKLDTPVARAARELADRHGRAVRVLFSREDVVRWGPKRPPIAASARWVDGVLHVDGRVVGDVAPFVAPIDWPYRVAEAPSWSTVSMPGPPTSSAARAVGLAERALLLEGALSEAQIARQEMLRDARSAAACLDTCVTVPSGAVAGARVHVDDDGTIEAIVVRVAAGDPLDEVTLRSYVIGAAHMALGWVLTESISVDPDTGEVHDLTIRSFGIVRPKEMPSVDVAIVDDPGGPRARASDAAFAAVAAAVWNAVATVEGTRPDALPARATRAARRLRG